ncbi:MAG: aspartate/glutamate racemase family protein [Gordonia sp. (in: high G+C Gram-positive bacteria)]
MSRIVVINPNSSTAVSASMRACLTDVIAGTQHDIEVTELASAPPGIDTDEHVREVIPLVVERIANDGADAFVIACFSDPGLAQARHATARPVVGIAESAYLTALSLGGRFGIVSLGPSSIARHARYLDTLSLTPRLAADISIDMTVEQLMRTDVMETLAAAGRQLRDTHGADVVILGCAGLGRYRAALQAELGIPVVDPVQAGVALAARAVVSA